MAISGWDDWMESHWWSTEHAGAHGFDWKAHFVVSSSPCPYHNSYFHLAFWFLSNIHEWRHCKLQLLDHNVSSIFPQMYGYYSQYTHMYIKNLTLKCEIGSSSFVKKKNCFRYLQILFFSSTFGNSWRLQCLLTFLSHLPRIIKQFWWDGAVTLYLTSCKNFEKKTLSQLLSECWLKQQMC